MKRVILNICAISLAMAAGFAHAGKADDTLVIADNEEIISFDKYYTADRISILISNLIYDTLLYRDPQSGKLLPSLATAWRWISPETLELDLRSGVRFHDGETFDADDVVYTFSQVIDPANKTQNLSVTSWIKSVQKTGPMQVRIHANGPAPAALQMLAGPLPIYGKDYYSKVGPAGMHRKPIGTGPYKVARFVQGDATYFERNDQYWTGGPRKLPAIGKIKLRTITDANTQMAEIMAGGVDWIWKLSKDQAKALAAAPDLVVKGAETMRIGYISMDAAAKGGKNPLQSLAVRQAVAHAINREAIVKQLMGEGASVIHAPCFPKQFGCTQDVRQYAYDPQKARQLLKEAGYPNGFEITLGGYRDRDLAEAMAANLRDVGIKAQLAFLQYGPFLAQQRSGKVPFNFTTWGSFSINDTSASTSAFFKFGDDDVTHDAPTRDLLKVADTSIDDKVRIEHYKKALTRVADQAFLLPLWTYSQAYAFKKELNFTPTYDELPRFDLASWK